PPPAPTLFPYTTLFRSRRKPDASPALRRVTAGRAMGIADQSWLAGSLCRITDQHSLAGADDQHSNHKDRCGPGPVPCLVRHHLRSEEHTSELQSLRHLV